MAKKRYEIIPGSNSSKVNLNVRGAEILTIPRLNRGTAFTTEEREELGLQGQLPVGVTTLEEQAQRTYQQYLRNETNLEKFAYLSALRDRNTVLFYRLLANHLEEMMPIVYTPTIGDAIIEFSHWYQRISGVFLDIEHPGDLKKTLLSTGRGAEDVDLIIVTDSEGILGIGDQGVGGIEICNGKKSLYTAAAGMEPNRILSVVLDVGTDNLSLLADDIYLGLRHARVRGKRYDDFIEQFVQAATEAFPNAMIHWEDFGASNAHRILSTYRDKCCTFNDDVQGTAAVVVAAALSAVRSKGEKMRDQRIVIHGAGTAGIGIADLLCDIMVSEGASHEDARKAFWGLGSRGLLTTALGDKMRSFQKPYARDAADTKDWALHDPAHIGLSDVVHNVQPTILIGTSAQADSFTEDIIREMAAFTPQPIIMPLSNPTTLIEAHPADILAWTDGNALIATGSPFDPIVYNEHRYRIAQANNAFVFPGLGLGVAVSNASRVSDRMIAAAAEAVASIQKVNKPGQSLLPRVQDLRMVSARVAVAVAKAAQEDGLARTTLDNPIQQVLNAMWKPAYPELILSEEAKAQPIAHPRPASDSKAKKTTPPAQAGGEKAKEPQES
ncbi:MAG: NAD-dependent malic enzyme [Actinomycetaceae bacterium]|nr:NAD-dependent malic enzyme [Actinomycetaceae bacterium]